MLYLGLLNAPVAQRLERHAYNVDVDGSNPSRRTKALSPSFNG